MISDSARSSLRLILVMLALSSIAFASIAASTTTNSLTALGNKRFPEGAGLLGPFMQGGVGQKIVFGSVRNGGNHDIFIMDADGSGQTRLTNNPAGDGFPAWSPNGTKIAFVSGDLRDTQHL
jgi:dipeptidyl aminopeptidase/acylaminoacyl peptidase